MKHNAIKTRIKALALVLAISVSTFPMYAFAASNEATEAVQGEANQPTIIITKISDDISIGDNSIATTSETYYVSRRGTLASGDSISGTFTLSSWFGNDFGVVAGAGNTGGSLGLSIATTYYQIPCDGQARVITSESGWSAGTYSYVLTNNTGNTTSYTLQILKP